MKLLHIADLHFGKRLNGMSMIDEQVHAVDQIISAAIEENVAGVLIAGDVFDRSLPSREALQVCERLFSGLCKAGIEVFAIPGNHDSAQQLAFCSMLLSSAGLHIARDFDGSITTCELERDGQHVKIHMLPFVRPTDVRMALPDAADQITSHDQAVRMALACDELDPDATNILIAHQFVTCGSNQPETCDSEVLSVGGADAVDYSAFEAYDYVALGHLHRAQHVGRECVRYSGTPLKYSFSEVSHEKSMTVLSIVDGTIEIGTRLFEPLHDMREVTAAYDELVQGVDTGSHNDYMRVTLTDRSLPDAMAKLRVIYPNVLRLDWQQIDAVESTRLQASAPERSLDPLELFCDFYREQTGFDPTKGERDALVQCIEEASK